MPGQVRRTPGAAAGTDHPGPDLIRLEDVHYTYPAAEGPGALALQGISLRVPPGAFVAVLGGNGSGKSTLSRLLDGLLLPDVGRVLVAGMDTRDPVRRLEIRRRVGIVFQDPENQIVGGTVEDDVAFGPENLGLPADEIERRVRGALATMGITALAHAEPHHLSGGQKQRVAIAGILAMEPDCICLDEPTSSLDPRGRADAMAAVQALNAAGHAVVLITHHTAEAVLARRVIVLHAGTVVLDATPREAFADAGRLESWGIEPPPATLAWLSLRAQDRLPARVPLDMEELADLLAPALRARGRSPSPPPPGAAPGPQASGGRGLRLEGIGFSFPATGGRTPPPVLDGVDLAVAPGECVGLLGATGSGKSTLALHAAALVRPRAGILEVDGVRPWSVSRLRRASVLQAARRAVGMVFQRPEAQFFEDRVEDEVAFGPINYGVPDAAARAAARAALERMGLPQEMAGRSPFGLSGGEMRRVAIASVLASAPSYLLLDEPTGGLDADGRRTLLELVGRVRGLGRGVLLITHRMDEAGALADRLVVLAGGRVVASGPPREVFALGPGLAEWGLEPPAGAALLLALRRRGVPVPPSALSLEEAVREVRPLLGA